MPKGPGHLPTHRERTVLNKLRSGAVRPATDFYPIGAATLGALIEKGWVELRSKDTYAITAQGEKALTAKLPIG
jgi:hypothetical protein